MGSANFAVSFLHRLAAFSDSEGRQIGGLLNPCPA
jgi:hypothetical protein